MTKSKKRRRLSGPDIALLPVLGLLILTILFRVVLGFSAAFFFFGNTGCRNKIYASPCEYQGVGFEAWDALYQCGYEPLDCPVLEPRSEASEQCEEAILAGWEAGSCADVDAALELCYALEAPGARR